MRQVDSVTVRRYTGTVYGVRQVDSVTVLQYRSIWCETGGQHDCVTVYRYVLCDGIQVYGVRQVDSVIV